MMHKARLWPLSAVLSITTGRLFCQMGQIYEIAKWATGEPIWTHQLPRVGKEIAASFFRQRPDLQGLDVSAVSADNWADYLAKFETQFGKEIALEPMLTGEHESIDCLSELADKIHPDRIVTVVQ